MDWILPEYHSPHEPFLDGVIQKNGFSGRVIGKFSGDFNPGLTV
jgi:hypothetical protein